MKDKITVFGIIKAVVILILIGIAVYEGYMIYHDQAEYQVAEKEYDRLLDSYVRLKDPEKQSLTEKRAHDSSSPAVSAGYPVLNIDFDGLIQKNQDFIAWLYIPDLDISYPVVQENKVDEYLYLTFDKTYNKAGCLFMDMVSTPQFSGPSDFIFGHNMKNLSMFGRLRYLYQEGHEDLSDKDIFIYVYTPTCVYQYQIYSYYSTKKGSYSYTEIKDQNGYKEFVDYTQKNSTKEIPENISFEGCPPLLTLSTCQGQAGSEHRFVVHAVRTAVFR